jgi:hypothetical protein
LDLAFDKVVVRDGGFCLVFDEDLDVEGLDETGDCTIALESGVALPGSSPPI